MGKGRAALDKAMPVVLERVADRLPRRRMDMLQAQWNGLKPLDAQIAEIERRLREWVKADQAVQTLTEIPGVGVPTASAAVDNRHQAATRPDIERQPCLSVCLNLRKLAQTGDVHIVSMTRNRGLNDILIVVVDGLCGFPDATQPSVQTFRQPCRPLDPQFTGFRPLERTQNLSRSA